MSKIRTRYAPSPTGRMHVGNLRTALYEYLIAKHEGGDFVLRIEDTDQERFVEGATEIIYRTIAKCGMVYDEGPDKDKIDKFELAGNRNLLRIFASTNVWNSYVRFNVALGNEYLCNIGVKKEDITYHINDLIAYMRMDLSGGCKQKKREDGC